MFRSNVNRGWLQSVSYHTLFYKPGYLPHILVPDLDDPLRRTGDKDVWDEGVPLYVVDGHVMGIEGVEVPDIETDYSGVVNKLINVNLAPPASP